MRSAGWRGRLPAAQSPLHLTQAIPGPGKLLGRVLTAEIVSVPGSPSLCHPSYILAVTGWFSHC